MGLKPKKTYIFRLILNLIGSNLKSMISEIPAKKITTIVIKILKYQITIKYLHLMYDSGRD